jgi:NAD(P)-dependent dehydrogenase (short-subunit alcohol dehydrogenase family)
LSRASPVESVFALSRSAIESPEPRVHPLTLDIEDEPSIRAAADAIRERVPALHLVIVATGILHGDGLEPEKTWRSLDPEALATAFRINAVGPALVAKHFLPLLARDRKAVFAALSARVGSISDNRLGGWHAYRTSKAALNMLIRTLAIELARVAPQALCVGLHPGTVNTGLSEPFQANVPEGRLFSPAFAAGRLLAVLDGLSPDQSGTVFAWDGQAVPF